MFSSKKAEEAATEVGAKLIGMVNTNTKVFCKETIERLTKDCPGGSYLVLRSKSMVPGGRLLVDIVYKYNSRKVLYFIVTNNAVITQIGLPCLSKYPGQFTNVAILPVDRPLFMYKFFSEVNEVDSHNKSRQADLVLDKFWVTQCGWIQLYTIVDMGITINNFGNCFVVWLRETTIKN